MNEREDAWYAANNCTHAHCPEGCQKPQGCVHPDGVMRCSRCWVMFGEESAMVPCTPETCEGDG